MNHKPLTLLLLLLATPNSTFGGWQDRLLQNLKPKEAHSNTLAFQQTNPKEKELITLSEELARRINTHSQLPERSPLGTSWLGESQTSNALSMQELLETLAIELGSSKGLGILTSLSENTHKEKELQRLSQSNNQTLAQEALKSLEKVSQENKSLKKNLQNELNKEGFGLTEDDIDALCHSPNAADHTTLISAFKNCTKISRTMEQRLLAYPSAEEAKKYYAVQFILLACLNKIQTSLLEKIQTVHIPKTLSLHEEAEATKTHAKNLLQTPLTESERKILQNNLETCEQTQILTAKTKEKLDKNFEILQHANQKTKQALETAQNSHKTMLLRNEVLQLDLVQSQEFEAIQNLIIPEMLAIRFSSPEKAEIVPRLIQTPQPKP
jgi:hypothetical protein